MVQPARSYSAAGSTGYRFGFNGKEKSDEIEGSGVDYDYGARIYDARVARWLSTDPISEKYPALSPYNFSGNNPLLFRDANGEDLILSIGITSSTWNLFKSIIEDHFNGLVTLTKTQITRTCDRYCDLPVTDDNQWIKVDWSINEKKLNEMAIAQAGTNASPDLVATKRAEILKLLQSNEGYKQLNTVITGNVSPSYNITDDGSSFGDAAKISIDRGISPQGISLDNIITFGNQDGLSPFGLLMHEVMEGYFINSSGMIFDKDFPSTTYKAYGYGHWNALETQARVLDVDFIYTLPWGIPTSDAIDFQAITFKQITQGKDKGKFVKTIYFGSQGTKTGKITVMGSPTSSVVSKKEYDREKAQAKEVLKQHTKKTATDKTP